MTIAAAIALMVAAPAQQLVDRVALLAAELRASPIATSVLERRCAALGLGDLPRIRAEVVGGVGRRPSPASRIRLKLAPGERVLYRRVRLMCSATLLSDADNWYVPVRLTPAMNAQLDRDNMPFGRVILPLKPQRRTLSIRGTGRQSGEILRLRAIVLDGDGRPLAEVVERYQRVLVD